MSIESSEFPSLLRAHVDVGAREYRVVRGSSTQDVYRSTERGHASAVRSALNELESQVARTEKPGQNRES